MNKNEPACPLCAAPSDGSDARRTERSEEVRRKLTNRLSRIEGQIRGIRQMIENDAYCNDDEDVFHDTATATGRFEAETDISTEELTVADLEVPDATAHL